PDTYSLSLLDALPIYFNRQVQLLTGDVEALSILLRNKAPMLQVQQAFTKARNRYKKTETLVEYYYPFYVRLINGVNLPLLEAAKDRKSTRLNSSHVKI